MVFLDVESTGLSVYNSEVIEAYFSVDVDGKEIDSYHLKSQVRDWSNEAEEIHKISYQKMMSYPDKRTAWDNFSKWIKKYGGATFISFCNPNSIDGNIIFDKAIIQNEMSLLYEQYRVEKLPFHPVSQENVYLLAKEAANMGYFTPIKGDSGRQSFKQENIYKALFDESYDAHDCIADTKSLKRIYYELKSGGQRKSNILI